MSYAYEVVRRFELEIAKYANAPYAVSFESCTAAMFLCCKYINIEGIRVTLPSYTYPSVANNIVHCGGKINFEDIIWQDKGYYEIVPIGLVDSAKRMYRNMYDDFKGKYVCLSFHLKKIIPIGRGGMLLLDNEDMVDWLKCARFDGRHEKKLSEDTLAFIGYNMYMTPDQAARGLELLQWIGDDERCEPDVYQDLSKYCFYKG